MATFANASNEFDSATERSLSDFFDQWRKVNVKSDLATFLRELSSELSSVETPKLVERLHNVKSLNAFVEQLRQPLSEAFQSGEFCNIWTVAGLGRDEMRNAAILTWLFDRYGTHGQRDGILKQFLLRIQQRMPLKLAHNDWTGAHYITRREVHPLGMLDNRVDIEIESRQFLILIETKIDANEGNDQLSRYDDVARAKANGRPYALLYLCVSHDYAALDESTIGVTWKDVAAAIRTYIRGRPSVSQNFSQWLVVSLLQLASYWEAL
jgi:hypothetical protein